MEPFLHLEGEMKDRVFYTDVNLFGPNELTFHEECGLTYLVGNTVDLRCCKTSAVQEAEQKQQELIDFAGDKYISGDRELRSDHLYHKTDDNVLMTYGDDIFDIKRHTDRPLIRPLSAVMYHLNRVKLNNHSLELIAIKAYRHSCKTIVLSYFHPPKLIDIEYNGINIIILPKGRTSLFI